MGAESGAVLGFDSILTYYMMDKISKTESC
jgi:hypothetical protein